MVYNWEWNYNISYKITDYCIIYESSDIQEKKSKRRGILENQIRQRDKRK